MRFSNRQVFSIDYSDPDAVKPRIAPVQRLSTLPDGFPEINYVGEIKIDGSGSHIYVSNRGHNSIAVFSTDPETGMLTREGVDSVLGRCPRHFGLSPDGRYAVVGVQDDDVVRTFRLCAETGRLRECVQEVAVPTPNFVLVTHVEPAPRGAGAAAAAVSAAAAAVADAAVAEARKQIAAAPQMAAAASAAGVAVCAN